MSATPPAHRPQPLHRTIGRALSRSLGVAGLIVANVQVGAAWECSPAADGRGWQCQDAADPQRALPTTTSPAAAAANAGAAAAAPVAGADASPTSSEPGDSARSEDAAIDGRGAPQPAAATGAAVAAATRAADEPAPMPEAAPRQTTPAALADQSPPPATAGFFAAGPMPDLTDTPPRVSGSTTAAMALAEQPTDRVPAHADEANSPSATAPAPAGTAATANAGAPAQPSPERIASPTRVATGAALPEVSGDLDAGIAWDSCRIETSGERSQRRAQRNLPQGPVEITADSVEARFDPQQAVFSGQVLLRSDGVELHAAELDLDRASGRIEARGDLLLSEPDFRLAGSAASYQLADGTGRVSDARYRVPAIRARGAASQADLLGGGKARLEQVSYSTCAPGEDDWLLTADALDLDSAEGFGTAHGARLDFLGLPLLYAPRFSFPIDDRRRSGVLVPSVGYTGNTGFDLSVPYYFNLAENYDLTLTPRLMSRRGLLLGGEFRFLTESTSGSLSGDFLPDDRDSKQYGARGSAALYSHSDFSVRTEADLRLNYVSDKDYLSDLGGDLVATSATHIERTGELRFHGDTWDMLGRVQYYQTLDDTILFTDRPYSRLPQLRFDLADPHGPAGSALHLSAEYARFHRDNSVRGHRIDLAPAVSLPVREASWFVEPRVGARYTSYQLTDQTAGLDDSPDHLTGVFSFDSGLYYDRGIDYFGGAASQSLEPRLYYLYVPAGAQADQPMFDTAALDFTFDNLFRENRYNGPDRVGDANQMTLALTSRVTAQDTGRELLRASIGQILYFDDRAVTLPGEPVATDDTSALVGEVDAMLTSDWRTRAGLQWNPNGGGSGTIEQALAQVSYRDDERRVFSAAYRLRDGVTNQTDLAVFWPLNPNLSLVGRHNYSLRDARLLEGLAGIEYGSSCCWRLRALARRYVDGTGSDHNTSFMLQLELSGLGRLGNDIDSTLERGIYGYRIDDQD